VQGFFRGISFRLAKIGVVIALFVGTIVSALQIYVDYRTQFSEVNRLVYKIVDVAAPPAARAVHTLDTRLATEVVTGMMKYDFIISVAIDDELESELASQKKSRQRSNTAWLTRQFSEDLKFYVWPLSLPGNPNVKGRIKLVVDMDMAFKPFYHQSLLLVGVGLLRSFLLVLFLFVAFYFMLTKPLIRIAKEVKAINPGSPGAQRISLEKNSHEDELKQLVVTTNQLLDAVDLALAKRRAVEVVLRKSEEHVRQIIDSLPVWVGARNRDGHYIFANKALAEFLQTSPEAMRGSHITDFSRFYAASSKDLVEIDRDVIKNRKQVQIWEEKWLNKLGEERQMHTHIMPMEFYDEVVALVVSSDITELKNTQLLMEHMAYHDALTDLPNRSYLVERLEEELNKAASHLVYGALLFIDLDQFKHINDSLGHPVGDIILKNVAERLLATTTTNDIVVRLGGDEFVVILTHLGLEFDSALLRAEQEAESIREAICAPYYHFDFELHVTCSVGIVIFPEEGTDVHQLLQYADTAMYQVKENGRDGIQFFNQQMADTAKHVLVMEGELHRALEFKRFSLNYQPRVDTDTNRIVGAEALLRWNHPERGMVSPAEFIPILETSGLIVAVGMWVVQEAIHQVKIWLDAGCWTDDMRIGVNISPRQFRSPKFVDEVIDLLKREQFPARLLEMEITEGIAIQNLDETIATMTTLRAAGVYFALDDFGTGYSSISYLKRLPVSILKIDQSFVRDITVDGNDRILVETISAMGIMLGLEVVAEGVETEEQLKLIRDYGCQYFQGYLSSKPLPAGQFVGMLDRQLKLST